MAEIFFNSLTSHSINHEWVEMHATMKPISERSFPLLKSVRGFFGCCIPNISGDQNI